MKKPFSVILSLVLLMSSLAIPMTVSAGGTLTAVRTVAFNDDTTVNCTGDYTLDNAIEGQPVSFTVKVKNGGSVTSVTYGGEEITADNGVYTITVDSAKTLEIKTTRDGLCSCGRYAHR